MSYKLRNDVRGPSLEQGVGLLVAKHQALGVQGPDVPLQEDLLLSEVAGSAALRVRSTALASPEHSAHARAKNKERTGSSHPSP